MAVFDTADLREVFAYGFPYVPNGVLTHVMGMGDRFILGMYMPLRDVGFYLIAGSVASLIKYFPVAFDVAWTPFAYDSLQRRDAPALFARMATYAFAVLALSMVALSGLGGAAHGSRCCRPTIAASRPLVPILALAMGDPDHSEPSGAPRSTSRRKPASIRPSPQSARRQHRAVLSAHSALSACTARRSRFSSARS